MRCLKRNECDTPLLLLLILSNFFLGEIEIDVCVVKYRKISTSFIHLLIHLTIEACLAKMIYFIRFQRGSCIFTLSSQSDHPARFHINFSTD